ncbi:thioesterase family protein [Nitrospirillum sp. BR 11752]|uniref:thioesterase family protein n=1 Tax=Nitrospirillum sp. BR 11752 TaxID=3104293 RepID=UPI002EA0B85E|nr:thioesterase family protein [Nitrospirillum sp. BR 11752]
MKSCLQPGLRHSESLTVDTSMLVPALPAAFGGFHDMPPVFATAQMVAFIEWTCVQALAPYLEPGERTVGTHVDVSHVAATPVGMTVTATVELIAFDGRALRFKVAAHDATGLIGEGFHSRGVIDYARFMARVEKKAAC